MHDADDPGAGLGRFDLVLFDNDGVLVDSEEPANRILAAILSDLGVPTTYEESVARYLGGTVARVRTEVEATGVRLPPEFEQHYERAVLTSFEAELRPVPGVESVLEGLAARGVPVAVASSGTHARIRASLRRTGLAGWFDSAIFSAEDVAAGKPAPDLFVHAAKVMGAEPARCLVVEDSPFGVQAALAAGMPVAGFSAVTPPERLVGATALFGSMDQLLPLAAILAQALPA